MQEEIKAFLSEHIHTAIEATEVLSQRLHSAIEMLSQRLIEGSKAVCCGYGLSQFTAELFATLLLNGLELPRPAFPAIVLTPDRPRAFTSGPTAAIQDCNARQLRALGQPGDVLVYFAVHDMGSETVKLFDSARQREMDLIIFSNKNVNIPAQYFKKSDFIISVPSERPVRVFEMHTLLVSCCCEGIDAILFPLFSSPIASDKD